MAVAKTLRVANRSSIAPNFTGVLRRNRGELAGNLGFGDVRGTLRTRVITLHAIAATDSFKIRVEFGSAERINQLVEGKETTAVDTVAFVAGTNMTQGAIQTALRTATGDAALTVLGTTDLGPFTVTQGVADKHRDGYELSLKTLVGMSGAVTSGPVTYVAGTGKASTATQTPSSPGRGAGTEAALGESVVTDGVGQAKGTTLAQLTIVSALGGATQVVIDGTLHASGGTAGTAGYAVFKSADDSPGPVVYTEDADADVTITGLAAATDYYVVGFQHTAAGGGKTRISRATAPVFFTTT